MRELTVDRHEYVAGASIASIFDGAVIGATSYALARGKWAGLGILNLGAGQAIGVIAGLVVGGVGGAFYGITHTSEQVESYFNTILANIG